MNIMTSAYLLTNSIELPKHKGSQCIDATPFQEMRDIKRTLQFLIKI